MNTLSVKSKIYLTLASWLGLCLFTFWYGFGLLENSALSQINEIAQQKKDVAKQEAELKSFQDAQQDIAKLEEQKIQPDDFFNRDETLVNEIKKLESVAAANNINFSLEGLSGTIKTAPKAPATGDIYAISASLGLEGTFADIQKFLQYTENLNFILDIKNINISASLGNVVNVKLSALFYLRK